MSGFGIGMSMSDNSISMNVDIKISDDMKKEIEKAAKAEQEKPSKSSIGKDQVKINKMEKGSVSNKSVFDGNSSSYSSSTSSTTVTTTSNSTMTVTEKHSVSVEKSSSWGGVNVVESNNNLPSRKNEIMAAGNQSFDSDKVKSLQNISKKELSTSDQKLLIDVAFNKLSSFESSLVDVMKSVANNNTLNDNGREYLFDKVNSHNFRFSSSKNEIMDMFNQ